MASALRVFGILLLLGITLGPSITLAKEFVVGDEAGWKLGFDYQAWAKGKDFRVGDKLIFKYRAGSHNVYKVDGTGFQQCIRPSAKEALTTGYDVVELATPGRKWYICGVAKHCEYGMKLVIDVKPAKYEAPRSSVPSTYPAGREYIVGDGAGWRLGFDYQAWAKNKVFRVGDRLVFRYPVHAHNVFRVDQYGFQNCINPPASEALTTGSDTIVLTRPGRKWYICGVGQHCQNGMKLFIVVFPAQGQNPPSSWAPAVPTYKPREFIVGDYAGWTLNFDYQAWAKGKDFRVGDKLVFRYRVGAHNVFKVDGNAFQYCTKPPANQALTTGNDTIVLSTPRNQMVHLWCRQSLPPGHETRPH
ncbi:hypothetical protein Tsubulata_039598, partial [Turnera subulata]